ncbi:MAG TPA: YdbC family protein [Pseudoneobacillus sp.]|nr:YdbC family protein [Pseudoneobacillus sp.]
MLVKWLVCGVEEKDKPRFDEAQRSWNTLKGIPGFLAQIGGWNIKSPYEACIWALWEDEQSYNDFMQVHHDSIFYASNQKDTYSSIRVNLYKDILQISNSDVKNCINNTTVLRVASCDIQERKESQFLNIQRDDWNPGMKNCPGMLGGIVSKNINSINNFLVTSLWNDLKSHQYYIEYLFQKLRAQSKLDDYTTSLDVQLVHLIDEWKVTSW